MGITFKKPTLQENPHPSNLIGQPPPPLTAFKVDVITVEPGETVIKFQNLLANVLQPFLRILRDANAIFFTVGSVW